MRLILTLGIIIVTCFVNFGISTAGAFDSLIATASAEVVKNDASEQVIDEQPQSISNLHEQITLLQDQNRLLKEHNRSLLTTVRWALGFAAVFLLAVFSLIWYFTHRRYDQDKESLKNLIETEVTKARSDLEDRLSKWEAKTLEAFKENMKSLEQSLNKIAKSTSSAAVSPLESKIESLSRDITLLEIKFLQHEAQWLARTGKKSGALMHWFDVAQKSWTKLKWDFFVSNALDNIKCLLEAGVKPPPLKVTDITAFLQSLPPQFEPLIKAIQSKI